MDDGEEQEICYLPEIYYDDGMVGVYDDSASEGAEGVCKLYQEGCNVCTVSRDGADE